VEIFEWKSKKCDESGGRDVALLLDAGFHLLARAGTGEYGLAGVFSGEVNRKLGGSGLEMRED
jgi:hypothetical protein